MEQETVAGFFILVLWLLAAAIPAKIASDRGLPGGPFLWWIAGIFLSLIAILAALITKPDPKIVEAKALKSGVEKKCPQCAELVKKEAIKCRFCGYDFSQAQSAGVTSAQKKCPGCGEFLMKEAVRCRHCGHDFRRPARA